jgi:hypothetical protein
MNITLHRDVEKYVLTSSLKTEDIELVKKYRPDALKIKNADGDEVFGLTYNAGKSSVAKFGITFGATNADGFAIVTGDVPADVIKAGKEGEYVADVVGAALPHINEMEAHLPEVVATIKSERAALIGSIKNA